MQTFYPQYYGLNSFITVSAVAIHLALLCWLWLSPAPPIHQIDLSNASVIRFDVINPAKPAMESAPAPSEPIIEQPKPTITEAKKTITEKKKTVAPVKKTTPQPPVNASTAPANDSGGSSPPEALSAAYANNPLPKYPEASRRFGEEGKVIARVCVGVDGRVSSATITQSSGHDRLDQATLTALKQWQFKPAQQNNQPVAGCVGVPWLWTLRTS